MLELHILGHYWRDPYILCREHPSVATVGRAGLDEAPQRISASNPIGVFLSVYPFHTTISYLPLSTLHAIDFNRTCVA